MSSEHTAHGSTAHQDGHVPTLIQQDAVIRNGPGQAETEELSAQSALSSTKGHAELPMLASSTEADAASADPHTPITHEASAITKAGGAMPPESTKSEEVATLTAVPASSEKLQPGDKHAAMAPIDEVEYQELPVDILVSSGLRKRFTFGQDSRIGELLAYIFKNWPEEWTDRPQELKQLRLLHRGHFLQDATRLSSCRIEGSTTVVMHLYVRPVDAEAPSPIEKESKGKKQQQVQDTHGSGCCSSCTVM